MEVEAQNRIAALLSRYNVNDFDDVSRPFFEQAISACFADPDVSYNEDFRIRLRNGKIPWIRSRGGMSLSSDGSGDQSFIGISLDVTDEKEYELALAQAHDTIKTIADELDHRMNNVFAITAALVSAGAREGGDVKTNAAKTRKRIMALAEANRLTIGKGVYGEASLNDLIEGALAPYKGTSTITIKGGDVSLGRQTLNSLGLIFHELATNALKYGCLNNAAGELSINWEVLESGNCIVKWRETSGGKADVPLESTGFGGRLIDLSIKQIDGSIDRELRDSGLFVAITFPINQRQ